MKNFFRNFCSVMGFPALYLVMQIYVTSMITFFYAIFVSFQMFSKQEIPDAELIAEQLLDKLNVNVILLLSSTMVLLVIFLIFRKNKKEKNTFKFNKISFHTILLCGFLGISMNFFISLVITLTGLDSLFPKAGELMKTLMSGNIFITILSTAILAPLIEEIIFRGIVLNRLSKMTKPTVAIFISALIFGVIHLNVLQGIYAFILGILLALLCYWYDSLYSAIAFHLFFNLTSTLLGSLLPDFNFTGLMAVVVTIVSFIVSTVIIYVLWKNRVLVQKDSADIVILTDN